MDDESSLVTSRNTGTSIRTFLLWLVSSSSRSKREKRILPGGQMIVYKKWYESKETGWSGYDCDGWFLFGIVPLYIRKIPTR